MEEVTAFELAFLDEANNLPEEYGEYFIPPLAERIIIPAKNHQVGDLEIRMFPHLIVVRIGTHTEARFAGVSETIEFIKNVVTDQIVFYFHKMGVEYYDFDAFESLSEADPDYHVWSGPFQHAFLDKR